MEGKHGSSVLPSCCIEHAAEGGDPDKGSLSTLTAPMTLMTAALISDLMTLLV